MSEDAEAEAVIEGLSSRPCDKRAPDLLGNMIPCLGRLVQVAGASWPFTVCDACGRVGG